MAEWKDISSFSRGQIDRTPTAYELVAGHGDGRVRLVVVRGHIYYKDRWTGRVMPFDNGPVIGTHGDPLSEAEVKAETIARARALLSAALNGI